MTVLFVGLGAMGEPISARLQEAVPSMVIADARSDVAVDLAAKRGTAAVAMEDLADVASSVRTVVLMLPDSRAVSNVLEGESGLLTALPAGAQVIDMGSSMPSETVRLAGEARARGVILMDAPVSGGVAKARTGELSIMVGAAEQDFGAVVSLLSPVAEEVTRVGPTGAGHAMKALNNLLSAIGLIGAAEVLAAGAAYGLQPETMLEVLNRSTGGNHATRVKMARYVLSRAFDSGFAMSLMVKDLRTALRIADDAGLPAPVSRLALSEWAAALEVIGQDADHTHVAAYVEGRTGVILADEEHREAVDQDDRTRMEGRNDDKR